MKPKKEKKAKFNLVVVLDSSGHSIGAVKIYGKSKQVQKAELVDTKGKLVQEVPLDITIVQAREILLKKKMGSYTA